MYVAYTCRISLNSKYTTKHCYVCKTTWMKAQVQNGSYYEI
jgi:hypothetical protein